VAKPPWHVCACVGTRWPGHAVTRHWEANTWARLYFIFSKLFNQPKFEILIGVLPDVQNSLNFVARQYET
jgi:hypothetical protein